MGSGQDVGIMVGSCRLGSELGEGRISMGSAQGECGISVESWQSKGGIIAEDGGIGASRG